jgi:subtilisin family serine protease
VTYNYQANITREQFCELVVLAYQKISGNQAMVGNISFNDTYNSEILKAANLGIVSGYGNGIFAPNDLITREQIATMLVRMIDKAVYYENASIYNKNSFADSDLISDWALPSVNFAFDNNIMYGVGDNRIEPKANTTCEQAILLVYRVAVKYYNGDAHFDSIYELSPEHIAIDNEECVHYADNIILAFIERGLDANEKDIIADIVDGEIVAQLAGSVNILQIEVKASTLDELNIMSKKLMDDNNVNYAAPDILIDKSLIKESSVYQNGKNSFEVNDEWWVSAVESDYVQNNYDAYINKCTVGVIDTVINVNHEDLNNKITFAEKAYENFNDVQFAIFAEKRLLLNDNDITASLNHGTGVSGIISANRNDFGVNGISAKSNIIFASSSAYAGEMDEEIWNLKYESELGYIYALKKQVDAGAKAINCSFGVRYVTEKYFNNNKEEFEFTSYANQKKSNELEAETLSMCTTVAMCELIKNGKDFLVVQSAGNGEDNSGPGVEAKYGGYWRGIDNNDTFRNICHHYNLSFNQLQDHYIIVGAVENTKENGEYLMTWFSNYGDNVDICAPGQDIKVCNAIGEYINPKDNKTYSTWYNPSSGTSEAAPMVTATAAVLWGIDSSLTSSQVKDYIIKGAKSNVTGVGKGKDYVYPMLNIRGSVELLLAKRNISVAVKDSVSEEHLRDVTVSCSNGVEKATDMVGMCNLYLPMDSNRITLSKEGYETKTIEIEKEYIGQTGEWINVKEISLEKEINPEEVPEIDYKKVLYDNNILDYAYLLPDDYNGDGKEEAYVIVGSSANDDWEDTVWEMEYINIYFIDSNGNFYYVDSPLGIGFYTGQITVPNGKFIVVETSGGGSSSRSNVYGCMHGKPFIPDISGISGGLCESEGKYVYWANDFSKGYHDYVETELEYNVNTRQFYEK